MKEILRCLLISFCLTGSIFSLKASHIAALDLGFTCMGGNDYAVRLVLYQDCGGQSAPSHVPLLFTCSDNPAYNFTISQVQLVSGSGQEVTPGCSSMPTKCNGGFLYGVREYVYQALVTLPPCNSWKVSWTACCRNPSNTLLNPTTTAAYIEAIMNNLDALENNSPTFANKPATAMCVSQANCYHHGAIDPDGDSLTYSLVTPFNSGPTTYVDWVFPYTATQPLPSNPAVTIDPLTGDICMTPTMNIIATMAVKVEEWRTINGTPMMIGTVYRDLQINVIPCTNQIPKLSGMDTTMVQGYDPNNNVYAMEMCLGTLVQFTIWGHDDDIFNPSIIGNPEKFDITWNQGIPNGTLQTYYQNTDSAKAIFTWIPNAAHVSSPPKCFTATITDLACPYNGSQTYSYCIFVRGINVNIGSDTVICKGESVTFLALTTPASLHYNWELDDIPVRIPHSCSSYTLNTSYLEPGKHKVFIKANAGGITVNCPGIDEIIVDVRPLPMPHLGNDTLIGFWQTMALNAGSYHKFLWSTGDTTQTILIDSTGQNAGYKLMWVQVTDGIGCTGSDTIVIGFISNPGIEEPENYGTITVHPNPSNGQFQIFITQLPYQEVTFEMLDNHGSSVFSDRIYLHGKAQSHTVDAGDLANGLYLLIIRAEGHLLITRKIIINKNTR